VSVGCGRALLLTGGLVVAGLGVETVDSQIAEATACARSPSCADRGNRLS
jgi:hypothetical protein